MNKRSLFPLFAAAISLAAGVSACATAKPVEPAPAPRAPAAPREEETPDVIRIAQRFAKREGRVNALYLESAFVKGQDTLAYYVGFARKNGGGRNCLALVKVHKQDGWAEWEEY